MKIEYKNNKLRKTVESPLAIIRNYGTRAKLVSQRLKEIEAAKNLNDFRNIPAANCHELKGQDKGKIAMDISGNHRIIFIPFIDPLPVKEDGGLDWTLVTEIKILQIGLDYH